MNENIICVFKVLQIKHRSSLEDLCFVDKNYFNVSEAYARITSKTKANMKNMQNIRGMHINKYK